MNIKDQLNNDVEIKETLFRYFSFWPYFLISLILSLIISYTYLRYSERIYESESRIEILDKSQDSEMALPTAMTVFNRSMINLQNEIGVLSSFKLHKKVVSNLKSNVKFYTIGTVKTSQNHKTQWFNDYEIKFNVNTDSVVNNLAFSIGFKNNGMEIKSLNSEAESEIYFFEKSNTYIKKHDLPFELIVNDKNISEIKEIHITNFNSTVKYMISNFSVSPSDAKSDQLDLSITQPNAIIAMDYMNTLTSEFDRDGVIDRQLEYKRTIDFVNNRAIILQKELEKIEDRKKNFKINNNLNNIDMDAGLNINKKFDYSSEIFAVQSQLDLLAILKESILIDSYELMPINIGLNDNSINIIISEYNSLVLERNKFLSNGIGLKNNLILSLNSKLDNYLININNSIEAYDKSLQKSLDNLIQKENEFSRVYKDMPQNEKTLRSIERELEIKESLFLLLLQKREEAAINFAVVKPSIKIIDSASYAELPVSPIPKISYLIAIITGLFLPALFLYFWFLTDTKIHTKQQLKNILKDINIIAEIPYINQNNLLSELTSEVSRNPLSESIRMLVANLDFINASQNISDSEAKVILVTSSLKGEGKTLASVNLSSALASHKKSKVLLIGSDLRNPQIHKFFNLDKNNLKGVSNFVYDKNLDFKDLIHSHNNLDILFSGDIPPNPTQILSSPRFTKMIDLLKSQYDYIIVDSAPCLLVSDTFEISKHASTTVYVIRANYTETKVTEFINELHSLKKLPNINLVLNSVGSSKSYGYKYGYQYGYQYGYRYGYNYGYGYGYSSE